MRPPAQGINSIALKSRKKSSYTLLEKEKRCDKISAYTDKGIKSKDWKRRKTIVNGIIRRFKNSSNVNINESDFVSRVNQIESFVWSKNGKTYSTSYASAMRVILARSKTCEYTRGLLLNRSMNSLGWTASQLSSSLIKPLIYEDSEKNKCKSLEYSITPGQLRRSFSGGIYGDKIRD